MAMEKQETYVNNKGKQDHDSDDGSSGSEGDSHNTSETPKNNGQSTVKKELNNEFMGHDETRYANRIKGLLGVIFLVTMVGVVTAIYVAMSKGEIDNFKVDFEKKQAYYLETLELASNRFFDQTRALCTTYTSYGTYRVGGNFWPNNTLPNIAQRGNATLSLSGAQLIGMLPLVQRSQFTEWEAYAIQSQSWLKEDLRYTHPGANPGILTTDSYPYEDNATAGPNDFVAPLWQLAPSPKSWSLITQDFSSKPEFRAMVNSVIYDNHVHISDDVTDEDFKALYSVVNYPAGEKQPKAYAIQTIFADITDDSPAVGVLLSMFAWDQFLGNHLGTANKPMLAVIQGTGACNTEFTYSIEGRKALFLGYGNLGNPKYAKQGLIQQGPVIKRTWEDPDKTLCRYQVSMYPTEEFESSYKSAQPIIYTCIILACFICVLCMFIIYDVMISRRHNFLYGTTMRTNEFVTSLFPENVHRKMLQEAYAETKTSGGGGAASGNAKTMLKEFTAKDGVAVTQDMFKSKPLADLFPNCTIMFCDLQGFTAWSSMREPTQVFMLLETIYHAFDQIANRRRVFKVETVGDCYVAVSGLPEPRKDHAVTVARFASDCIAAMPGLLGKLSTELGPDTSELQIRVGLNSGPVTAGVLRGEKARFQLFGDTVNTTARMETTGAGGRIHISLDTADIIMAAGKGHWLEERKDMVHAKGKGTLKTFWLKINKGSNYAASNTDSGTSSGGSTGAAEVEHEETSANDINVKEIYVAPQTVSEKYARLIDWNTEILFRFLRQIVAKREALSQMPMPEAKLLQLEMESLRSTRIVLEEQVDVIELPKFDAAAAAREVNPDDVAISDDVHDLLRELMQDVACGYRENPFHSYDHCSHVTMSVVKLLSRIVAPDLTVSDAADVANNYKALSDHTYGITNDPLVQFSVVLSALIHDVDHMGIPNSQLIKEGNPLATVYKNKSVAEQNSVDIVWSNLMEEKFKPLRRLIYATKDEFYRFRQLVVNTVMATDIMDKDLSLQRKARWNKAFAEGCEDDFSEHSADGEYATNRKATIVIEHLIQASDVAHTMQHWHIYRKWNARLFEEMYVAFKAGRGTDPAPNWYKGEIGFFDFYIIPLAKKLKDCGVFGVSSDEYLTYAQQNRKEWENRGAEAVAEMVANCEEKHSQLLYL